MVIVSESKCIDYIGNRVHRRIAVIFTTSRIDINNTL